ncbi:uncharacterized protein LOC127730268 [Mytilus californianus]|uniref:uncharacterized protein LOC127730268 n=1 Tax=Mytilus californianus TaxID=6549 RepID=UPI002246E716|nr:uncharacterized protein LOC127730268 [Mytilus californianus]
MRVYIGVLLVATLLSSGYCQFTGMMENPALMMAMMKGMGGGGKMPMGGMDMSAAPIMDPKMFQMAKLAAMMGPNTMAGKGKGKAAKPTLKMTKPAAQPQSSGIDPMMIMLLSKQAGGMDPLTMSLLMSSSSPKPAAAETASSGIDPATMYMLMQSGMFG